MPKPNPSKLRNATAQSSVSALDADLLHRHAKFQRLFVITMGCLWLMAFATGCSRSSKNCSAYDGVDFSTAVETEQVTVRTAD